VLLGVPPLAVLIFEIVLNGMALYNHSNVRLPERIERVLRWFVVTPEMHIIHHSTAQRETDSNYGFNLALWDRLFGTYSHRPAAGYDGMVVGPRPVPRPFRAAPRQTGHAAVPRGLSAVIARHRGTAPFPGPAKHGTPQR
jgi:sterol desaturase/sphingolipid hydroxylase (fatty acid hydroxylase superfamily)